ncbi:hypothetical protein BD560DRAFT_429100 [Blakeslea trispora]|nr:hypothetical protein BD560DRAFT_429100 [Blakeslea trispora]
MNFLKPTNKSPPTIQKYRTLMYCWDETNECAEFLKENDIRILNDSQQQRVEEVAEAEGSELEPVQAEVVGEQQQVEQQQLEEQQVKQQEGEVEKEISQQEKEVVNDEEEEEEEISRIKKRPARSQGEKKAKKAKADSLADLSVSLLKARNLFREQRLTPIDSRETVSLAGGAVSQLVEGFILETCNKKIARFKKYVYCYHLRMMFEERCKIAKVTKKQFLRDEGISDNLYNIVKDMMMIGEKLLLIVHYMEGDISCLGTEELLNVPLSKYSLRDVTRLFIEE